MCPPPADSFKLGEVDRRDPADEPEHLAQSDVGQGAADAETSTRRGSAGEASQRSERLGRADGEVELAQLAKSPRRRRDRRVEFLDQRLDLRSGGWVAVEALAGQAAGSQG